MLCRRILLTLILTNTGVFLMCTGAAHSTGSRNVLIRSSARSSYFPQYVARKGSKYSSYYISNVPSVRYGRAYKSDRTQFYKYYKMYFYHSGASLYVKRAKPNINGYVCANYEVSDNGTTMGIFSCPNSWEPHTFVFCCGHEYEEFCCQESKGNRVGVIVGATIGAIIIVFSLVYGILSFVYGASCSKCPENCGDRTEQTQSTCTIVRTDLPRPPIQNAGLGNIPREPITRHGRVSESEDSDYLPPYDVAMHSIYDLPVTSVNRSPPISRDRTKYILQNSDPRRSAPPMSEDDEYTGAPGAESVSSRQNDIHGDGDQDQDSPLDNPIGTSTAGNCHHDDTEELPPYNVAANRKYGSSSASDNSRPRTSGRRTRDRRRSARRFPETLTREGDDDTGATGGVHEPYQEHCADDNRGHTGNQETPLIQPVRRSSGAEATILPNANTRTYHITAV